MSSEMFLIIDPLDNESVFTYYSEFGSTWRGQTEIEVTVLVVIFIIAVTSNILILIVIYRRGKNIKVTDIFIANISVSDLLYAANIPIMITARISPQWLLGTSGCKILLLIQCLTGATSILSVMIISIDRFVVICRTKRASTWSKKRCLIIVIVTWLFAFSVCCPILIGAVERNIFFEQKWFVFCAILWPPGFGENIFLSSLVIILFVVPLIVSTAAYVKIFVFVRHSSRSMRHTRSTTERTHKSAKFFRPEIRLVKMFVAIIIIFVVTWLPFFVALFALQLTESITSSAFLACVIVTQTTACIDPIVYGYFNEVYRVGMKEIMWCKRHNAVDFMPKITVLSSTQEDTEMSM